MSNSDANTNIIIKSAEMVFNAIVLILGLFLVIILGIFTAPVTVVVETAEKLGSRLKNRTEENQKSLPSDI